MNSRFDKVRLEQILGRITPDEDRSFLEQTIKTLAERDYLLTEIFNRAKFEEDLSDAVMNSNSTGQELSLILLDIDGFKNYNDTHGHRQADKILKELARYLRQDERSIYRYGGEEFALILPTASLRTAVKIAMRIRRGVEQELKDSYGITVSLGVAKYEKDSGSLIEQIDFLVIKADEAMYRAKAAGKNCVKASKGS